MKIAAITAVALLSLLTLSLPVAAQRPDQDYLLYVLSESADRITLIRFGPQGARIEREIATGLMEPDIDGPHGIAVSPDKRHYFVSLGHGRPFGTVWKYATNNNAVLKKVTLGLFPASMDVSPDGSFLYVVNFNLHGDMVPSSVSVVLTDEMIEVIRIPTCTMPHGSRFNPQGTRHYSACMMDDLLVEIDTSTLKVSRHFLLARGREAGMRGAPAQIAGGHKGDHHASGSRESEQKDISCSPTWAQPSADGSVIFVACNRSGEIVEVDAQRWQVTRRIAAGPGVYNLAVTRDGKLLVATNKGGASVSVFEIRSGKELARIATKRRVVHGVTITPDNRYAFVSVEGVGREPGTVEIIDLRSLQTVASVDVAQQAAGIEFFRTETATKPADRD